MKTNIITIILFVITCISSQLVAQESITKQKTKSNNTNERTAGYDLKKGTKLRVMPTETGCSIAFDNIGGITGGALAGKRGYDYYKNMSSFSVSSSDNSVSKIVSPRDAASGLPTGKRQHKPITITKELDKSAAVTESLESPVESSSSSSSSSSTTGTGTGKASFQDLSIMSAGKATFKEFTVTKRCDGKTTTIDCPNGECDIPLDDCPNGTADLVCSWSWGVSNSGSMSSGSGAGSGRCAAGFSLEIQDCACTAMAINEKGLPGEKKPNTSTTNNPK